MSLGGSCFSTIKIELADQARVKAGRDYLLVAGGRAPAQDLLLALAKERVVCCADRGVSYCRSAGIVPSYLIGDGDSGRADWAWAATQGVRIERHPEDKNQTDLQLALEQIASFGDCATLTVTGIWGGRFDHAYSAVLVLASWRDKMDCPIVLVDQEEFMIIVGGGKSSELNFLRLPQVLSLLPFSEQARVSLRGVRWPLEGALLERGNPYAISNQVLEGQVVLNVHSGQVGLYCLI